MSKKIVNKLIDDLESRDDKKVIAALKRVPQEGTVDLIIPMLHLLAKTKSTDVQMLLQKSLFNLKDPKSISPLVEALRDEHLTGIRIEILNCIWQSGLHPGDNLPALVSMAINSDYMVAVEVMTIIESAEGFSDDQLSDSIKMLDKALERKTEMSDLLGNIRQLLLDKLLDSE